MATPWHSYLTGQLSFPAETATHFENFENVDSPEKLLYLNKTDIEAMCENARGHHDHHVPFLSERGLIASMHVVQGRSYCSRTTTIDDLTHEARETWKDFMESLHFQEDSTFIPNAKNFSTNWVKAFETLDDYFHMIKGDSSKVSLYYIIRPDVQVKDEANDPEANYTCRFEEMCMRMPHCNMDAGSPPQQIRARYYEADNCKVWDKLEAIFHDTPYWTHLKPFMRARDGRAGYMALFEMYLGPKTMYDMAAKAEAKMAKLRYVGGRHGCNFKAYVNAHLTLHGIFAHLKKHGGHQGISEASKVQRLMSGIHDRRLDVVEVKILLEPELKTDFMKCVHLCNHIIRHLPLR